jgi:ATP-dependent Clp protease adaptor protein ClpS
MLRSVLQLDFESIGQSLCVSTGSRRIDVAVCAARPPGDPKREAEREGGVATRARPKVERPQRYKVLLFNDDYTPMEFVVAILEQVFGKGPSEATAIMLKIHNSGLGVAGVYVLELAETKVATVHRMAEERGYPLRAGTEKE